MSFYIGARYKNIGIAEYDKYHFCNDTFDASNDSYIFTNIEKMKKRRDYHKNLYGIGDKVRVVMPHSKYHGNEGIAIGFEPYKIVVIRLKNGEIKKFRTRAVEKIIK